jgi:hypothetical protein
LALRPAQPSTPASGNTIGLRVMGETTDTCSVTAGRFPTGSDPELALCFWNQKDQEYLKYGQLVSSSKNMSLATEVVADAFGGVRIALSTAVAASTDSDSSSTDDDEPTTAQDRVLNLLTSNGGNLALTGSYPIYYRPLLKDSGSFVWNSYVRAAANMQAFGGETQSTQKFSDVTGNLELAAFDMHADLLGFDKKINLLGYFKASGIVGTKKFAQSLSDDASNAFVHGQLGAGVRVGEVLMIYVGYNWFSDANVPGRGATLSVVVGK